MATNICVACGHAATKADQLVTVPGDTRAHRIHQSHTTDPDSGFYDPQLAKDASNAWIGIAVLGLAVGVLTGRAASNYGAPVAFSLFVAVTAFYALYMGVDHFWSAWLRAKTATKRAKH